MKDLLCDQFQETVGETLIRHRSVLDVMAKLQETTARTNRAVTKAVTTCGCVKIVAEKQHFPADASLEEARELLTHHVQGKLCEQCQEIVEQEIGHSLFYLAALCNIFDLSLYDILLKEQKRISTLGVFTIG
jgi:phosphoribosyl-ATP pyrophosphohydrolase